MKRNKCRRFLLATPIWNQYWNSYRNQKPKEPRKPRQATDPNNKVCVDCNIEMDTTNFYNGQSKCKPCKQTCNRLYRDSPWGDLLKKIHAAYNTDIAAKRATRKLKPEEIINLFIYQKGLCNYSNYPLSLDKSSQNRYSIERINNDFGHLPGNICLIALTFQSTDQSKYKSDNRDDIESTVQWTRQKFFEAFILRREGECIENADEALVEVKYTRDRSKRIYINGQLRCKKCKTYKNFSDFPKNETCEHNIGATCKQCTSIRKLKRSDTFQAFMNHRLSGAKERTELEALPECDLGDDIDYLVEQWNIQKGRCYHTRIPMNHLPQHAFVASLEKIIPKNGYVRGNVAWVVLEVNTPMLWTKDYADILFGAMD